MRSYMIGNVARGCVLVAIAVAVGNLAGVARAADGLKAGDIIASAPSGLIRIDPISGEQTRICSGHPLEFPGGIAVEPSGNVLVSDWNAAFGGGNDNPPGGIIRVEPTLDPTQKPCKQTILSAAGDFVDPFGIALEPEGNLLVADASAFPHAFGGVLRIHVDSTNAQERVCADFGPPLDVNAPYGDPLGVALGPSGEIHVVDASSPEASGVYRCDASLKRLRRVSVGGNFVTPVAIAAEANGNVIVADLNGFAGGKLVRVIPSTGTQVVMTPVLPAGDDFRVPAAVAVEGNGDILVGDANYSGRGAAIVRLSQDGQFKNVVAYGPFADFGRRYMSLGVVPEPDKYVALGDSFSSGEGVPPFFPDSDFFDDTAGDIDTCHRSMSAYSRLIVGQDHVPGALEFWACSGAIVADIFNNNHKAPLNPLEPAQREHVDQKTTLVTLSLGGDNAHFADVLEDCVNPFHQPCKDWRPALFERTSNWATIVSAEIKRLLVGTPGHPCLLLAGCSPGLWDVYETLKGRAAAGARILVVGYPNFIGSVVDSCSWSIPGTPLHVRIVPADVAWINGAIKELNAAIKEAAEKAGVEFIDTSAALTDAAGDHSVCSVDPWINAPMPENLNPPYGLGDKQHSGGPFVFLFHPNGLGQDALARAIIAKIEDGAPGDSIEVRSQQTVEKQLDVAAGQEAATFSTVWPGSDIVMSLRSPSGRRFERNTDAVDVTHTVGRGYELYSVTDPEPGLWTVRLYGAEVSAAGERVRLVLSQTPVDAISPTTEAVLSPAANESGWTPSDVKVVLHATDDEGGQGVDHITYAAGGAQSISPTTVDGDATIIPMTAEGTTTVSFFATDNAGNIEDAKTISVRIDKTPPRVSCFANPAILWPPDHKMLPVKASVVVTDDLSGPAGFALVSATANEGDPVADIAGFVTGDPITSGSLRAERLGNGGDRMYSLTFEGMDAAGNDARCVASVVVPHDQRKQ